MPNYESHITIDGKRYRQWLKHCDELEVKPVQIQLDSGTHMLQTMCTYYHGELEEHVNPVHSANSMAEAFRRRGHKILRVKCERELVAGAKDVSRGYYEAHMKLVLPVGSYMELRHVAKSAGLAVSKSLMRPREDGQEKWFLTDRVSSLGANRVSSLGANEALTIFAESLEIVREAFPEAKMEQEAVIYDTAPELDEGWKYADLSEL